MIRMETIMLSDLSKLTPELILRLIQKHKLEAVPRLRKLRRYYEGEHDILKRTFADDSKPNIKIVNNFCRMISDVTQGYFTGHPVTYTSQNDNYLMHLEDIYNVNIESNQNSLLSKDMSIFGVGFELLYMDDESEIRMTTLPVEEVIMIYNINVKREPLAAIRYYTIKDYLDPSYTELHVEVYTDKEVLNLVDVGGSLVLTSRLEHFFGICPVIPYCNNDEELGDFEGIMSLQDAYNEAVSDQANDFAYMADSYLVIVGAEDTEDSEFLNMKRNRMLILPENGEADWLVKKTDNQTVESYKNRLTKDIHRFSNVPDINSEDFMTDISGTALKYRWQAMEQACANKERLFVESLYLRQKAICNILAIKGLNFQYADVTAHFKRNLPVNMNETIQLVATLKGVISDETLLSQLPFIDSVQEELEKIEEEMDDPYADFGGEEPTADLDDEKPKGAWSSQIEEEVE